MGSETTFPIELWGNFHSSSNNESVEQNTIGIELGMQHLFFLFDYKPRILHSGGSTWQTGVYRHLKVDYLEERSKLHAQAQT